MGILRSVLVLATQTGLKWVHAAFFGPHCRATLSVYYRTRLQSSSQIVRSYDCPILGLSVTDNQSGLGEFGSEALQVYPADRLLFGPTQVNKRIALSVLEEYLLDHRLTVSQGFGYGMGPTCVGVLWITSSKLQSSLLIFSIYCEFAANGSFVQRHS